MGWTLPADIAHELCPEWTCCGGGSRLGWTAFDCHFMYDIPVVLFFPHIFFFLSQIPYLSICKTRGVGVGAMVLFTLTS